MTVRDEPTRRVDRADDPPADQELPTPPVESPGDYYEFGDDPPEGAIIYPSEGADRDPSPSERK
jgi:hypothetical protein